MGLRNGTRTNKLNLKKETLRKLELLTLSDDQLRRAAGGRSGCCGDEAPSIKGPVC